LQHLIVIGHILLISYSDKLKLTIDDEAQTMDNKIMLKVAISAVPLGTALRASCQCGSSDIAPLMIMEVFI